jgi:hypothetical protein
MLLSNKSDPIIEIRPRGKRKKSRLKNNYSSSKANSKGLPHKARVNEKRKRKNKKRAAVAMIKLLLGKKVIKHFRILRLLRG